MLRALVLALVMAAAPAAAQQTVIQPVLVLDVQQLLGQSERGKQLLMAKAEAQKRFQDEGAKLAAALEAEERELTELRDTMPEEEFAKLAEAFDQKVVASRNENAAQERALNEATAQLDAEFQAELGPVIAGIMQERGAGVVLQKRAVFFNGVSVDITDEVIARMDKAAGLR